MTRIAGIEINITLVLPEMVDPFLVEYWNKVDAR